ncbi:MAG: hypothetical protein SA339_13860 [Methanomassiliicoccus sp.]|nr:hypothetical protein [Methanomassiliicoccus sp.]
MDESISEMPVAFPSLNKDPMKDPCYQEAMEVFNSLRREGLDAMEIGKVVNFLVMLSRKNIEAEALLDHKPKVQRPAMFDDLDLKQRLLLDACIRLSKFTAVDVFRQVRDEHSRYFERRGALQIVRCCPFVRRAGTLNGSVAYLLTPETVRAAIAEAKE